MEDWLRSLSGLAVIPLATIAVFEGTRRLSWARSGLKFGALMLFGIITLGGNAGSSFWMASTLQSTLAVLAETELPRLSEAALAQMSPQEREEKTRLLAQVAFGRDGSLTSYLTATGNSVQYAPSEKEIRDRQRLAESLAQLQARLDFIRTQAWILILSLTVGALTGVYVRFSEGGRRKG